MQRSNQFDQFSELGQHEKSRRVIWSCDLTGDHLPKAIVQGIRRGRGNCRYCLTRGGRRISKVCRDLFNSISFFELGRHEKSRRVIRSIWSRDLTCDHIPKPVAQGIRRGRGNCRYCLTHGGCSISKVCRDIISSISFLS